MSLFFIIICFAHLSENLASYQVHIKNFDFVLIMVHFVIALEDNLQSMFQRRSIVYTSALPVYHVPVCYFDGPAINMVFLFVYNLIPGSCSYVLI